MLNLHVKIAKFGYSFSCSSIRNIVVAVQMDKIRRLRLREYIKKVIIQNRDEQRAED